MTVRVVDTDGGISLIKNVSTYKLSDNGKLFRIDFGPNKSPTFINVDYVKSISEVKN